MAMQKANAGCPSCAQNYFALAHKYGATEEEIYRAIEEAAVANSKGISRRDLFKLAAAAVAGVALGTATLLPKQAEASSYYWGTDSNSASCDTIPQDFYIGRFGYGTTGSTSYFNTSAAQKAGYNNTYIYWGLEGPASRPKRTTPYNWGVQQAQTAINQRTNNPNASYAGGNTTFADIESGFRGWRGGNSRYYSNNQQVVQGFLDTIVYGSSFHPGIYITLNNWGYYFGTAFVPAQDFVLWLTGCHTCGSTICAPCSSNCSTTQTDVENLLPTITSTVLGGSQAVLWQYWLAGCSAGDFNVATQSPFAPVHSATVYHSGC
jgi:hypothetical protein